jgi:hypothetical protein
VDDLKLKVDKMTKYWDLSFLDNTVVSTGLINPPPPVSEQTAARSSAGITAARPNVHRVEMTTRADGVGGNSSPNPFPDQWYAPDPNSSDTVFHGAVYDNHIRDHATDDTHNDNGRLPKLNFPFYEGDHTRLWITQAEDYFDMYDVHPRHWVRICRMHFRNAAARWIESLEQPDRIPWPDFCKLLHDRFGRDQRDKLARQMFYIHQTSTVQDYVERSPPFLISSKSINPILTFTITQLVSWMVCGMTFAL